MATSQEKKESIGIDSVPFSVVTDLFRDLRQIRSRKRPSGLRALEKRSNAKHERLHRLWMLIAEKCCYNRDVFANRKSDDIIRPAQMLPPEDAFKIISLIHPMLDSMHTYLGMKHTKLSDAFVKALDLIPGSDNAEWLKHYQDKQYRPEKWKLSAEITDGSLPTVLKAVLQGRCPTVSTLTIGDVWGALNILFEAAGASYHRISRPSHRNVSEGRKELSEKEMRAMRIDALRKVLQAGTPEDVAEFSRIVLKDSEIRLSQDEFFAWFHPCAKQHYNQTHDIMKLIKDCHDPAFKMGDVSVQVGRYASVMLTQRPSRKNLKFICNRLCGDGDKQGTKNGSIDLSATAESQFISGEEQSQKYFLIEPKLDGERMELHMTRTYDDKGAPTEVNVQTFSRRGYNSSDMYANALRDIIGQTVRADSIILDGEIMIWDLLRESWVPFSRFRDISTSISHGLVAEGASYVLKFMVFDVLYVEQGARKSGTKSSSRAPHMVVRLPLNSRRRLLQKVLRPAERDNFPGLKSAVEIVTAERGQSEDDLLSALQRFCSAGYEGVIAKCPDMPYAIGERNPDIAVKLKPDYFDGGLQDLDVIILGARLSTSYSRAGRSGDISSFLIGVRDDGSATGATEAGVGSSEGRWVPVGAVGTGYSDDELGRIREQLKSHWQDFDVKHLPAHISRRQYPKTIFKDVVKWIPPSKSVVLTVRAYELIRKHTALRFPRVERINWEKPPDEVITLQELEIMDDEKTPAFVRPDKDDVDDPFEREDATGRTSGSNRAKDDAEAAAIARATAEGALVTGGRSARGVLSSARGADVGDVKVVCKAFDNLTFLVIGAERDRKEEIEIMVYELGGKFVQNLTEYVDFVIGLNSKYVTLARLLARFESEPEQKGTRPVVRPIWVERCREQEQKVDLQWPDLYFAPPKLRMQLLRFADRFGDPWDEDTTTNGLIQSIQGVTCTLEEGNAVECLEVKDIRANALLEDALRREGFLFRGCTFYVPEDISINPTGAILLVRLMGGTVVRDLGENMGAASKVLVHSECRTEWNTKARTIGNAEQLEVVTDEWVRACLRDGKAPMIE